MRSVPGRAALPRTAEGAEREERAEQRRKPQKRRKSHKTTETQKIAESRRKAQKRDMGRFDTSIPLWVGSADRVARGRLDMSNRVARVRAASGRSDHAYIK